MNKAHPANTEQEKADHMPMSSASAGVVSLHTEKSDIPQYGKKVSNVPNPTAGGTTPAGKVSSNQADALGNPGRFKKQTDFTASAVDNSKLVATRMKQLGSNGYQGN